MGKAKVAYVPAKASPLAKRVAKLCRTYREHRGWSYSRAAELLGIKTIHYRALEQGKFIPGPTMCRRLRGWIVEKLSYEGAPALTEMAYLPKDVARWRITKVPLELAENKQLVRQARALGMSNGALASIYVKQGLRSRQAWATLQQAILDVQLAFSVDAIEHVPELADLLKVDADVLGSDVDLRPYHEVAALRPAIMQVVEIPLDFSKEEPETEEVE